MVRLIPKDEKFYDLFIADGENLLEAARALEAMVHSYDRLEERVTEIQALEKKGDQIDDEVARRMQKSFITPFDREDIHALASALDDVLDNIEGVSSRFALFKVQRITPETMALIDIIEKACQMIHEAVKNLRDFKRINEYCIEINKLENDADLISRNMTARLFEDAADFRELIKWKELYGRLEATTDDCEDVANILEGIVVKNN